MSPPDANIEKQKRRHWFVLVGMAGAMVLAFLAWLVVEVVLDESEGDTTPTIMEDEAAE